MKYILMNRNKKVMLIELNLNSDISRIYEIYNIDFAPLSVKYAFYTKEKNILIVLNRWYSNRIIPGGRNGWKNLCKCLNIKSTKEVINKAYSLSLSDQYWLKPENSLVEWKSINFFNNDFQYEEYLNVSLFFPKTRNIDLYSPNNTTEGVLAKAWIIENGKRFLIKDSYFLTEEEQRYLCNSKNFYFTKEEPINEYLVSQICKRLEIDYCNYEIEIIKNKLVSKCKNFLKDDEEIITASDILKKETRSDTLSKFEEYIDILNNNGIKNARKKVTDMYLIDFLVLNTDRHMKNYGIIRNVETLKWEKVTPIFDTGESLQCNKPTNEINFEGEKENYFGSENITSDFGDVIDFSYYDMNKLKDIPDLYYYILKKYQPYTRSSDRRIEKLVQGIKYRIELAK